MLALWSIEAQLETLVARFGFSTLVLRSPMLRPGSIVAEPGFPKPTPRFVEVWPETLVPMPRKQVP